MYGTGCTDCNGLGQVLTTVTRCPPQEELQPLLDRLANLEASVPRAEYFAYMLTQPGAQATLDVILSEIEYLQGLFDQLRDAGCIFTTLPVEPLPVIPLPPIGTEFESYLWEGIAYIFGVGHGGPTVAEIDEATAARNAGLLPVDDDGYPVADFRSGTLVQIVTVGNGNGVSPPQTAGNGKGLAVLAALLSVPFFLTR